MRLCILVPSEDYREQAGARIRYQRIEGALASLGHSLTIRPVEECASAKALTDDVYVISKCHDARALVVADVLAARGKCVGVDLFDDYYSQQGDPRMARMRLWLADLRSRLDFALCSTPAFARLATQLLPGLPCHVMNDPAPPLESAALASALHAKRASARSTRTLRLAWFGMGDNPRFPVGLSDLVAFGGELARLRGRGWDVHLQVLTNRRALTADTLAMLRRLPLAFHLDEWSLDKEASVLSDSFACFLPVNAQSFSVVKSLNRAATALASGVQVLSSGFPLYEALDGFIYRDPLKMLGDLEAGQPLLREDTMDALLARMVQWADASREAHGFANFLKGLPPTRPTAETRSAVIHGRASPGFVHKFAQRAGALSVASPFCTLKVNFDVKFEFAQDGRGLQALVAGKRLDSLPQAVQARAQSAGRILDQDMWRIELPELPVLAPAALRKSPLSHALLHGPAQVAVRQVLADWFPGIMSHLSETADLSWHAEQSLVVKAA